MSLMNIRRYSGKAVFQVVISSIMVKNGAKILLKINI